MVLLKLLLIILLAIAMKIISYRTLDTKRKYEFQNRKPGGNVAFKNYKASKKHERVKYWAGALNAFALATFFAGILFFLWNIDEILTYF